MAQDSERKFRKMLEAKGLKYTLQRQKVLDYLVQSKKHVTPEEIYRDLNAKDHHLGRATVFRTLHLLQDAGFADKILFADGRQAFEYKLARPHHDHMICVECSAVIEFANPTIERLQQQITQDFAFEPLWHRHEIFGRCKKCAHKKPASKPVPENHHAK